ncbi:MAG: efflux RND transporter periplasmic adaptor subunit [Campylobacterota bacterium]|nr:efflux RND transporter periplasmic adaptor subunit [Campylobacterota bacterium]
MRILSKIFIVLLMGLSVFIVDGQCKEHETPAHKQIPITTVDVYKVLKPSDIPIVLEYPARLKSIKKVQIVARATGTLIRKFYTEGQFVKKGDLLYKIEPDSYQAAVDGANALLQMRKAQLNKAGRDWNRIKTLYEDNAVSQRERDAVLSVYKIAKADIANAKANLKMATINLNYTSVKAPLSGITGLKCTDVGNLVTNGTPLTAITQVNPIYAEFSIPDINIIRGKYYIKNGNWEKPTDGKIKTVIKINGKQYKETGFINFIGTNIDVQTSTVKARGIFQNPKGYLMPGEFVRIMLHGLIRKDAIMIPQKAVLQNPLGTVVFVVNKGKAQARPIKLGETSGNYYIIEQGLQEGNLVIVNNFFRVKPGMPVKIDKIINTKKH